MIIFDREKNYGDYVNFLNKFIEKYKLDNILQSDLNYGFYFKFNLQYISLDILDFNKKKQYYYLEHIYILKIINIILEILGFKAQVKDYIIFFNYNVVENSSDDFYICICFKKEINFSIEKEKDFLFKMSQVGSFSKDDFLKPGNFYACLEDIFCMLSNDGNVDFLSNKMSDEQLYKYLFNIYQTLKEEFYDKNKYYFVREISGGLEHLNCFIFDNKKLRKNNNLLIDNIWQIESDEILSEIVSVFTAYCLPFLEKIEFTPLGKYQYGVMKGYGNYEYLDLYVTVPFLRLYMFYKSHSFFKFEGKDILKVLEEN